MDMHVLRGLCTIKMYMKIPDPFEIKTIPKATKELRENKLTISALRSSLRES